jgi:hypothetical protein
MNDKRPEVESPNAQTQQPSKYSLVESWTGMVGLVTAIAGLVVLVLGAGAWIDNRAEKAVLDEKVLGKLAEKIRPFCIVDSKNIIEANRGADEYIEGITVTASPGVYGYDIAIKCKRHLNYPPLVTALNVSLHPQIIERRRGNDWLITMTPQSTITMFNSANAMDVKTTHRFMVEILH